MMSPFPDLQSAGSNNIIPFLVMGLIWWLSSRAEKRARSGKVPPKPVPQPRGDEEALDPFAIFRHPTELDREETEPLTPVEEGMPEHFTVMAEAVGPDPVLEPAEQVEVQPRLPEKSPSPGPKTGGVRRTDLQRAVIWAEILGKPVGLKEEGLGPAE